MNYPEEIMHDVAWSFVGMQYRSQKQFIEAVNDYNEKLAHYLTHQLPHEYLPVL